MSRINAIIAHLTNTVTGLNVQRTTHRKMTDVPNLMDGPVVKLVHTLASGIYCVVHADEGDDIDALTTTVYKALHDSQIRNDRDTTDLDEEFNGPMEDRMTQETTLCVSFDKTTPLLDNSDYRIGEIMQFMVIEHTVFVKKNETPAE
jgi:hypothetical protein